MRSVARVEFFPLRCELWDGRQWAPFRDPARVLHEGVPLDRRGAAALLREIRQQLQGLPELSDGEALQVLDAPARI